MSIYASDQDESKEMPVMLKMQALSLSPEQIAWHVSNRGWKTYTHFIQLIEITEKLL